MPDLQRQWLKLRLAAKMISKLLSGNELVAAVEENILLAVLYHSTSKQENQEKEVEEERLREYTQRFGLIHKR